MLGVQQWIVDVSCCVADMRCCLPTTSVTGVQQLTRYCGALPCRHLCMMTPSLYVTRSATLSQCKSSCKIWVRPWSNFLVSLTTRAAAFITRCRVSVTDFVTPASTALHWSTLEVMNVWTSVAADSSQMIVGHAWADATSKRMLRTRWTHDAADSCPTRLSLGADGRRLAPWRCLPRAEQMDGSQSQRTDCVLFQPRDGLGCRALMDYDTVTCTLSESTIRKNLSSWYMMADAVFQYIFCTYYRLWTNSCCEFFVPKTDVWWNLKQKKGPVTLEHCMHKTLLIRKQTTISCSNKAFTKN